MQSLTELCGDVLLEQEFATDTCLQLFVLASSCKLDLIMDELVPFIAENFQTVKLHERLLDLPVHPLCRILSESSLNVTDECEVLDVVLRWLHRGRERHHSAAQLLQCVRWTTMEMSTQEWTQLKNDEAIRGNEAALSVVQQAIVHCLSPAHRWSLSSRAMMPRPSTAERHVLATIGFYGACIWMEEEEKWLQTKFQMENGPNNLVGMFEHFDLYSDTLAVAYDRRLFMALLDPHVLIYCEDILAGTWKQVCKLPKDMEQSPLVVAPGYLYMFGERKVFSMTPRPDFYDLPDGLPVYRLDVSSCCSTSNWKPQGKWEKAPSVPHAKSVSCGFFVDNKMFLLEKELVYGSKVCPKSVKGVHVFDVALGEWTSLDDPREDWQNNSALKRIKFQKDKPQQPAYVNGKLYLSTTEHNMCVLDLATMEFDLDPDIDCDFFVYGTLASYDDEVIWLDDNELRGYCSVTGEQTTWPKMPLMDDSKIIVLPVRHSELQTSWKAFFGETEGKTSEDFWYPADGDGDGDDEYGWGPWGGGIGLDDDDDELDTDDDDEEEEEDVDEDDDSDED